MGLLLKADSQYLFNNSIFLETGQFWDKKEAQKFPKKISIKKEMFYLKKKTDHPIHSKAETVDLF